MGIKEIVHSRTGAVVAGAAVLVTIGGVGGAVAAGQITSSDIRDQTIKQRDIARGGVDSSEIENGGVHKADIAKGAVGRSEILNGSIDEDQLSRSVNDKLGQGAGYAGPHWGVVDRNVIGNGDAYLRSGPFSENFGSSVRPPEGDGSLGLRTGSAQDKAAFGNQVDFVGDPVQGIDTLKYSIYTTGENGDGNLPNLQFEIDPNLEGQDTNYSTLGFVPNAVPANKWTQVDATSESAGAWYLTGAAGTATQCTMATPCSWQKVKTALDDGAPDASIWTVQLNKGRDSAFVGAVDALVLEDVTYDFEPNGVIAR